MKASEGKYNQVDWIATGFGKLDEILGGGIPTRKITEISGVYSVGKSTLSLMIIARAQADGYKCLLADSEFSFSQEYSTKLGVDCDKLELIQERFAETAFDEIEAWADANKDGVIVLDSVGALLVRAEAEKEAGGKIIGGQARLIANFCRKIVPLLAINNNALIVLNHQFTDIMSGAIKTSGGMKLEYAKSIWLMLRKANRRVMQGDTQIGDMMLAEIRKNKLAPTMKQTCELTLLFGQGFSKEADLLDEYLKSGEIVKKGNTYFKGKEKMGVGAAKAREWLKTNP